MTWRLPLEPTPDEVAERMRQVFSRPEFRRTKSLWERFIDWLNDHLPSSSGGSGSSWGGAIGALIGWTVLVLLVVAAIVLIVHVVRTRSPRARARRAEQVQLDVEEHRSAGEWASDAEQCEREGRWKDAVRARYRELVERLVEAGVADPFAGRTTGELRADVVRRAPGAAGAFSDATLLFELPWYAAVPTGPEENAEFRRLAADVLARVADRPATAPPTPEPVS